jgi:DNA-binding protein H-NS
MNLFDQKCDNNCLMNYELNNFKYPSMTNLHTLSPEELQILIKDAQTALEQKQAGMRKEVIAQIKELADSIGVTVEIIDNKKTKKRASGPVSVKYANPSNPNQKWTGRGMQPKWLKALIAEGHQLKEFQVGN